MNTLAENMKRFCLRRWWLQLGYDDLAHKWLRAGFLRHGKVYHPVFCVGVRNANLRTPVTVLVSLDRIIPWQFAPQQMPASVSSSITSYRNLGWFVNEY